MQTQEFSQYVVSRVQHITQQLLSRTIYGRQLQCPVKCNNSNRAISTVKKGVEDSDRKRLVLLQIELLRQDSARLNIPIKQIMLLRKQAEMCFSPSL
jgi:hypothetical protein